MDERKSFDEMMLAASNAYSNGGPWTAMAETIWAWHRKAEGAAVDEAVRDARSDGQAEEA
jgi:hypothetical protein